MITKGAVEGETIGFGQAVKQSLRRFWPLVGGTIVYTLIAVGVVIAFMLLFGLFVFLFFWSSGEFSAPFLIDPDDSPVLFVLLMIVVYLLFLAGMILVPGYFVFRWSFYLPFVLLEGGGLGIGKSWGMTKGSFWRLLGMYMVVMIMYSIFYGGIQMVVLAGLGASVLGSLIMIAANCLLLPWGMIVYSLAYLDLRVRREGTDLEMMLAQQPSGTAAAIPAEKPEDGHA